MTRVRSRRFCRPRIADHDSGRGRPCSSPRRRWRWRSGDDRALFTAGAAAEKLPVKEILEAAANAAGGRKQRLLIR
jgi:hypothetical protein